MLIIRCLSKLLSRREKRTEGIKQVIIIFPGSTVERDVLINDIYANDIRIINKAQRHFKGDRLRFFFCQICRSLVRNRGGGEHRVSDSLKAP